MLIQSDARAIWAQEVKVQVEGTKIATEANSCLPERTGRLMKTNRSASTCDSVIVFRNRFKGLHDLSVTQGKTGEMRVFGVLAGFIFGCNTQETGIYRVQK